MGMESVYKLSVILNLVDNLSGQMGGVGDNVSGVVNSTHMHMHTTLHTYHTHPHLSHTHAHTHHTTSHTHISYHTLMHEDRHIHL